MARLANLLLLPLCFVLAACETNLLEGLDERQANEVVAVMLHNNIPAAKSNSGKRGFVVSVGQGDLPEAIELLQREELPSAPRVQVATSFPADAMVSTPQGERARLISAIEQRLENTLSVIDGVMTARVHVSYNVPANKAGGAEEAAMHVAALLVHAGNVNEQVLVQETKRFLRNSFARLEYDNISVLLTPVASPRALAATVPAKAGPGLAGGLLMLLLAAGAAAALALCWRGPGRAALAALRARLERKRDARAP